MGGDSNPHCHGKAETQRYSDAILTSIRNPTGVRALVNNSSITFPATQSNTTIRWIALAGWVLIVLANLLFFGFDLASDYADMLVPCEGMLGSDGPCNFLAVSAAEEAVLASWGLTLAFLCDGHERRRR